MKEKTCCFTGHRDINENAARLKQNLKSVLTELIESGYLYFGVGGARGFDTIAAEVVLELKNIYPKIKLILVLPCSNQTIGWSDKDIKAFERIKKKSDKIRLLSKKYYNGCMQARNRHLVDNSSVCICFKKRDFGGTAYTVRYATKQGLRIINLAP